MHHVQGMHSPTGCRRVGDAKTGLAASGRSARQWRLLSARKLDAHAPSRARAAHFFFSVLRGTLVSSPRATPPSKKHLIAQNGAGSPRAGAAMSAA
mmetsp:Transcript_25865/g.65658  ORF Transcript_25865/g.65658 Transcript_25865/m.65658 type:complete len:96 (+) Transcript_25865:58-345(+)